MLELLPTSSMDSSIVTPVLIGVLLVWLFQETLGWGLSGLVVPGYLASILVIQPESGALVFVEAVLTCIIVRALSDGGPRWLPWSPFFGRERFFHIVLVATAVRLALEADGGLLDQLARATGWSDIGDLNAVGLVLVPLMANTLWRSGLARGIPRVGIPVLLTWATLELLLLPYTNVSLSSFQLTFEDLALDFDGSAKAHLLVLVGAALAAAANLHWGWDMGGIIVPGLLTLIWLDPSKLTVTLLEAMVVAGALRIALRLPFVRRWNLAGGRILVLGFGIDYLLRTCVAWTPWQDAGLVLSALELQGFGYLLPTLIAVRIHQHREVLRVVLPVAGTSFAGLALGSALGLGALLTLGDASPRRSPVSASPVLPAGLAQLVDRAQRGGELSPGQVGRWIDAHSGELTGISGGTGALHVRMRHRTDAMVVATLGEPGIAQAAWVLATIGETRGLVLCAPRADDCTTVIASLRAEGVPVWRVEADPSAPRLRFSETLAPTLSLRELSDAYGMVNIEAEAPLDGLRRREYAEVVLQLPLQARLKAASLLFSPEEVDWNTLLQRPLLETRDAQESAEHLRYALPTLVLDPWLAWYDTGSESALEAAHRSAHHLGLQLGHLEDRSILHGGFWRASIHRTGAPLVFHVPDEGLEPGAAALADTLAWSVDGAAVVVDSLPHHPIGPPHELRPAQIALARILEHIARLHEGVGTATVRGLRDVSDPGGQAVLHSGRIRRSTEAPPPVVEALSARLLAMGTPPRTYDGRSEMLNLTDAGNVARHLTFAATGTSDHVTLHAATRLRDRYSSVLTEGHPLEAILRRAELPEAWSSLDALAQLPAAPAPTDPAPPVLSPALLDAHRQLVEVGGSVELANLQWQARLARLPLELVCTPELGCRWLRVGHCTDGRCSGALLPLHAGPTQASQEGRLDRILFDSTPIPVSWGDPS